MMAKAENARKIAVIGLGYVGLPVAVAFGRLGRVIGFDVDRGRLDALAAGRDPTGSCDPADLAAADLVLSDDPATLAGADFFIITVPTPLDSGRLPDLGPLESAARLVGPRLGPGAIVVVESTVHPGATEERVLPILAAESGLTPGADFAVGYSPERINPGDRNHRFETIPKVVAAQDPATAAEIARIYGTVIAADIHVAPSIPVAEASKLVENVQRDLNIALMNEMALIFHRLGIDTGDVLAAAGTKWNFLPFTPGLVGGHCIGVDPYYLAHRAQRAGYHPEVILAGRRTNEEVPREVGRAVIRALMRAGVGPAPRVTVLGLAFKPDVPDLRNTKVADLVDELTACGITVQVVDPVVDPAEARLDPGIAPVPLDACAPADAVVLAVAHEVWADGDWGRITGLLRDGGGFVADLTGRLARPAPAGVTLWRL